MSTPTVRRRRLGAELRRIREARGLLLEDVERATGFNLAKLSRLENAKTAAKVPDVTTLLDAYAYEDGEGRDMLLTLARDGGRRGWWQSYRDALTPVLADQISLESEATAVRTYEQTLIPGLLQTADYARAVIGGLQARNGDFAVEARVEVRMARQAVLTKPTPLQLWAVIHQAALTSRVGSAEVMRGQLQKLIDVSRLPNVNIQVMPANASVHPGLSGPFTILGFPERTDLDVVLIEGLLSSLYVEEPEEVSLYATAFQAITAEAMPLDASLSYITEQKDAIP